MFRLEQVKRLRLVVAVPESLSRGIRRGVAGLIYRVRVSWRELCRVVARPAFSVDPRTRTMPVALDVTNIATRLAPGMYAEVAWPHGRGRSSLFVPLKAIKATTERIFVTRIAKGVAEWVDVHRGVLEGKLVEVFGN